ncbi:MAG TPA: hypothetical protein VHA30_00850 [Patescibacteria group bacterium]|nr:hypothetical protein [Patescibacteria group bacterium]
MNKKVAIEIAVIVAAFGGAGIVLYNGFFAQKAAPVPAAGLLADSNATSTRQGILPYGPNLDFSVLGQQNLHFGQFSYPQLNANDYGVPQNSLIIPAVSAPGSSSQ